jgi:LacI family transcriptional regulator
VVRVTILDVAERAGVSRQTVSRAMNDSPGIDPETRERVLAVARALGYRPSTVARGLKTNRTTTLGLVVPDIANPFFAEVVRGASEVAYAAGYSVLLCNTTESPEREYATLEMLEAHRVDGLLLVSPRLTDAQLRSAVSALTPVVLVNRLQARRPGLASVLVNDASGAQVAVEHLNSRGHRNIGFLGGQNDSHSARERREGYRRAVRRAGLPLDPRWCEGSPPTVEGGRTAAQDLLARHPELTALLAYNDLVALGVLQACEELERPVPDSLALVGWDDIVFSAWVSPPLTTMRMPKAQLGEVAMQQLFELIEGPERAPEPTTLDAELIVRGTT